MRRRCAKEACAECTRNCLLIHGQKKDPSPIVITFFKVMIGDDFSELLFLPPRFIQTIGDLVGKKIHIEDTNGQRWEVTVSKLNGSLAFREGWCEFSLDHGLMWGDFLIFHYIIGSHFVAQIMGASGCEKFNFPKENDIRSKRIKTCDEVTAKDGSSHATKVNSMNKKGSSASAVSETDIEHRQSQQLAADNNSNLESENGRFEKFSMSGYMEEPFYMPHRDIECDQVDDRAYLCDLSIFEMQTSISKADEQNKLLDANEGSNHHACALLGSQNEESMIKNVLFDFNLLSWEGPSDAADHVLINKSNYSADLDEKALISERDFSNDHHPEEHVSDTHSLNAETMNRDDCIAGNDCVLPLEKVDAPMSGACKNFPLEFAGKSDYCDSSMSTSLFCQSGKGPRPMKEGCGSFNVSVKDSEIVYKVVKFEPMDSEIVHKVVKFEPMDSEIVHKVVKSEPMDSVGLSLLDPANLSLSVMIESLDFLELPASLPFPSRRVKVERKVVLLRGSNGKLWPVLYLEKYGLAALTSGWEAFSNANGIQPEDECVVALENYRECIFSVCIIPK